MLNKQMLPLSVEVMLYDSDEVSEELSTIGDTLTIPTQRTFRDSGEMIAPCTIARTGVMEYRAKDLGGLFADRNPMDIIKVMTTAEELFAADSLESYRSCPLTLNHPRNNKGAQIDVTLENNKELQKGMLEGLPFRDENDELAGTVVFNDQETIGLIDDGYDQLSSGHKAVVVRVNGKEWDAEKTKIRANHIAVVKKGRAGTARIADEDDINIDDKTVITDDDSSYKDLSKLQAAYDELKIKNAKLLVEHEASLTKLADSVEEISSLNTKLTDSGSKIKNLEVSLSDEKAKNISDDEMQRRVNEKAAGRLKLLTQIAKLGDVFEDLEIADKSDTDIKREVLSKLRDEDFSSKTDVYVDARFDAALEDSAEITLSDALNTSILSGKSTEREVYVSPAEEAKQRRLARYK